MEITAIKSRHSKNWQLRYIFTFLKQHLDGFLNMIPYSYRVRTAFFNWIDSATTFENRREWMRMCVTWGKLNAMLPGTTDGWVLSVNVYLWLGEVLTTTCLKDGNPVNTPRRRKERTPALKVFISTLMLDEYQVETWHYTSLEETGSQVSFPQIASNSKCLPVIRTTLGQTDIKQNQDQVQESTYHPKYQPRYSSRTEVSGPLA